MPATQSARTSRGRLRLAQPLERDLAPEDQEARPAAAKPTTITGAR